jgi:hypothetical protein
MCLSSDAVTRRFEVKERERMGAEWAVAGGIVSAARMEEGEEKLTGEGRDESASLGVEKGNVASFACDGKQATADALCKTARSVSTMADRDRVGCTYSTAIPNDPVPFQQSEFLSDFICRRRKHPRTAFLACRCEYIGLRMEGDMPRLGYRGRQ